MCVYTKSNIGIPVLKTKTEQGDEIDKDRPNFV